MTLLAGCDTTGQPTTTAYLPNVTKTLGGAQGFQTPFIVQNVGVTSGDLDLSFYRFGDGALFAREDCLEASWAVVDPVLTEHHRALAYKPGSWGPKAADALIAADGGWHDPVRDAARA